MPRLSPKTGYEFFPHQADIGIRGIGKTKEQAFEQMALALTGIAIPPNRIKTVEEVKIHCQAPNTELLLTDWLNALIYEADTRKMLFGRFQVRIQEHYLTGTAWGEPIDPKRHEMAVEPKGATYTSLAVTEQADGSWIAQCIIDV